MSVRKRPVITVVDARPMDEVGFRDARVSSGSAEAPKLSPPPPKNPPVCRPPPPSNVNAAATANSNPVCPVPRRTVASANKMPSDLTNALFLEHQLNKTSEPPPPKPRRVAASRPMTIHVDGLNNNILPDRTLHPPASRPVASKRTSVRSEETTDETFTGNLLTTNESWNTNDWSLDASASTKIKPEVAPKRPTIIRVPTGEVKSESGGAQPPPVAAKSLAAKQHAAECMSAFDEGPTDSNGFSKLSMKPKPSVRAKPGPGTDTDPVEDRPQPIADVRKRPTIIRPLSVHATPGPNVTITRPNPQNSVGPSTAGPSQSGANIAIPSVIPRNFPSQDTPSEEVSLPTRTAPMIVNLGSNARGLNNTQPELSTQQQRPEIPAKHLEKPAPTECPVAPQPKKRPNIIRPSVESGRRDAPESTVTITSGAVRFSASGTSVSSEQQGTVASPDVLPEKQNAENWKRIEMDDRQSVVPSRPSASACHNLEGLGKKSTQSESKQPPSKPPPPRMTASSEDKLMGKTSDPSKSLLSDSAPSHHTGPPARPASGPTTKPVRPTQPTKRVSSIAEMAPSLPRRPTLGHPLFHYVVTGPHAIALFEYKPTHPDELKFNAGDVILLEKWINSDWLQGRTARTSGMFPSSFVDVIEAPPAPNSPSAAISKSAPVASATVATPSSASWPGKGPRCCARFDYDGGDPADLTFDAGDVICLVERVGSEWMRGELNGKVGMFPVGFVEIIEDLPQAVESADTSPNSSADVATALFDFQGQPGELSLLSGTSVKILGVVNSEWLYGEFEGEKGRFPRTFVDHVPSGLPHFEDKQPQTTHDKMHDGPHCFALYDFVGDNPEDLSFSAGERISLLTRVGDDWLNGEVNGRQGIFPASFVQIVKDLDDLPPRPKVAPVDTTPHDTSHNLTTRDASNVNVGSAVEEKSSAKNTMPSPGNSTLAVAIYDFPGQTDEDLTFHIGDVIEVTEVISSDWMSGKVGERSGIFPASFVKISS